MLVIVQEDLFRPSDSPEEGAAALAPGKDLAHMPLAARFRPRTLEEYFGQAHLLAPGKPLRRLIESDRLVSIILYGPPGVGKTSLAEVIARATECHFVRLNAVESSVAEVRKAIATAALRLRTSGKRTILFIDEIHRFNKAQQDVLLPDVEAGTIRLIGATTHNPSFYLNGPLVSRSQIFALTPLSNEDLAQLIQNALADKERGLGNLPITLDPDALTHLAQSSDGDARRALNALELAALSTEPGPDGRIHLTREIIADSIQRKTLLYDHDQEEHYNTISAFIKSVRGGDPDAALYWLAKMIEAGEDPRFIARRLIILAAEDIGLADPRGLMVAVAAHQAVELIGWPEGRIPLAEATVYLATAPKSNAAYMAVEAAIGAVQNKAAVPVPWHLRNKQPKSAITPKDQKYLYSHDFPGAIAPQSYGITEEFYTPTEYGYEKQIAQRLEHWKTLRASNSKPPPQ